MEQLDADNMEADSQESTTAENQQEPDKKETTENEKPAKRPLSSDASTEDCVQPKISKQTTADDEATSVKAANIAPVPLREDSITAESQEANIDQPNADAVMETEQPIAPKHVEKAPLERQGDVEMATSESPEDVEMQDLARPEDVEMQALQLEELASKAANLEPTIINKAEKVELENSFPTAKEEVNPSIPAQEQVDVNGVNGDSEAPLHDEKKPMEPQVPTNTLTVVRGFLGSYIVCPDLEKNRAHKAAYNRVALGKFILSHITRPPIGFRVKVDENLGLGPFGLDNPGFARPPPPDMLNQRDIKKDPAEHKDARAGFLRSYITRADKNLTENVEPENPKLTAGEFISSHIKPKAEKRPHENRATTPTGPDGPYFAHPENGSHQDGVNEVANIHSNPRAFLTSCIARPEPVPWREVEKKSKTCQDAGSGDFLFPAPPLPGAENQQRADTPNNNCNNENPDCQKSHPRNAFGPYLTRADFERAALERQDVSRSSSDFLGPCFTPGPVNTGEEVNKEITGREEFLGSLFSLARTDTLREMANERTLREDLTGAPRGLLGSYNGAAAEQMSSYCQQLLKQPVSKDSRVKSYLDTNDAATANNNDECDEENPFLCPSFLRAYAEAYINLNHDKLLLASQNPAFCKHLLRDTISKELMLFYTTRLTDQIDTGNVALPPNPINRE